MTGWSGKRRGIPWGREVQLGEPDSWTESTEVSWRSNHRKDQISDRGCKKIEWAEISEVEHRHFSWALSECRRQGRHRKIWMRSGHRKERSAAEGTMGETTGSCKELRGAGKEHR